MLKPAGRFSRSKRFLTRLPENKIECDELMKILFSEEQIARRIEELAMEMTAFYAGKPLTAVILMNGGLLFGADLVRAIRIPLRWEAFSVSSYADDVSSGKLKIRSELKDPVEGRHLLVIDDILDTGLTLNRVVEFCDMSTFPLVLASVIYVRTSPFFIWGTTVISPCAWMVIAQIAIAQQNNVLFILIYIFIFFCFSIQLLRVIIYHVVKNLRI